MSEAAGVVLDLLVPSADDSSSEHGRVLASSILHSRQGLDKEAQKVVDALSSRAGDGELGLLVEAVGCCSSPTLVGNMGTWSKLLTGIMKATTDPAVFQIALSGVSALLKRVCSSPDPQLPLDSQHLSPLLHTMLSFSASEPPLQAMVLRFVAQCLVHANSSCSQHRPSLKKWASAAAFHSHLTLAQEASRVLVLLCRHSNQQWSGLLECVLTGMEWTLDQLHKSNTSALTGGRGDVPKALSSWLDLPSLPLTDPDRTACLVQILSHLGRLIRYSLLFPPSDPSVPPAVPLARVLTAVSLGLRPAPSGHVVEVLVLQATLPVVHVTMWNVLCVLITTCHTHLLPYAGHMTSLLTTALCSNDVNQSPSLLAAVHRTLTLWVGVTRDCSASSLAPWLRALLWSSGHAPFCVSSLEALSAVIESVGPLVTPPLASSILHLPMTGLTPSAPAQQAMLMLQLLMACVRSGNSRLCPPTSAAIQLLREVASHHASREVVEACRLALSHCCSLNYPLLHPQTSTDPMDALATPSTSLATPTLSSATAPSMSLATPMALTAPPSISLATPIVHSASTSSQQTLQNVKRKRSMEFEETETRASKRKTTRRASERTGSEAGEGLMVEAGKGLMLEEAGERLTVLAGKATGVKSPVAVISLDSDDSSDEGAASGMEHFVADSSGLSEDEDC